MECIAAQLSPQLVNQQLQHLLKQEEFRRSPVLTKFLKYVVRAKLSSCEDEIREYTIAVKALGRPIDFKPQFDPVVRIHAGRLRHILFHYYQGTGKDDTLIITIPKGTYVPVFEVKNEKEEKLHPNVRLQNGINGNKRPLPLPKRAAIVPMLAVLPFYNLSLEQSNNSFLTALGIQLSTELARYDNLSVISFYATQKMDADKKHLNDLKNIGVDYILTGSQKFSSSTMRLNIQLMNVDSGNVFWSDSFLNKQTDRDAFDTQDEIISQIATAVANEPKMLSALNKFRHEKNLQKKLDSSRCHQVF